MNTKLNELRKVYFMLVLLYWCLIMCCTWDEIEMATGFWWKSLKESGCLEIVVIHGSTVFTWWKVKVKTTLENAMEAQRGSRGIGVLFNFDARWGGWLSAPCPGLFTPGKTRCPLYSRLGEPKKRSGEVRKISPPPGCDPLNRSEWLYRLRCCIDMELRMGQWDNVAWIHVVHNSDRCWALGLNKPLRNFWPHEVVLATSLWPNNPSGV